MDGIKLEVGWHPLLKSYPKVETFIYNIFDGNIMGSVKTDKVNVEIKTGNVSGENIEIMRNESNDLIMWYLKGHYINQIGGNARIIDLEPRTVVLNGLINKIEIKSHEKIRLGNWQNDYITQINKRKYQESTKKLIQNKEFLQYGIGGEDNRKKAIENLQYIIKKNCENGIYLWDPYADASDILTTAYFCEYANKKIKVINSGSNKIIKRRSSNKSHDQNSKFKLLKSLTYNLWNQLSKNKHSGFEEWKQEQITTLRNNSNNKGINLEIRCQRGQYGWKFHDRFIIFPLKKPKVWSLGTSINNIGRNHSILMSVNNPQNILDAFNELWDELENSVLWEYPED